MNRVEIAANACDEIKPLELLDATAPVMTPIIVTLAAGALVGGGVGYVAAVNHGYSVVDEVPAHGVGEGQSSSELVETRLRAVAG
jgi:hypothetical protein